MPQSSTLQDAVRLLFIFYHGSDLITDHPDGYTRKFESRVKAFAMDFWVRYPDFLAHELLNRFEKTGEIEYFNQAKSIIDSEEPDLRTIPMIRYRFGAYEDLTETIALLKTKGLVYEDGSKANGKILHYEYYLTSDGQKVVEDIRKDFVLLKWYDDRAALVKELCGNLSGSDLKKEQYKHMTYASTKLGGIIPSIKMDVIERINKLI